MVGDEQVQEVVYSFYVEGVPHRDRGMHHHTFALAIFFVHSVDTFLWLRQLALCPVFVALESVFAFGAAVDRADFICIFRLALHVFLGPATALTCESHVFPICRLA